MNPSSRDVSRRSVVRAGAWSAPAIVVATAAPAYAGGMSPIPAAAWTVSHSPLPIQESLPGRYFFDFDINVGAGTLGTLTMTWLAAPGGFIGDSSSPTSFQGWTGVGAGASSGDERAQWIYTNNINPVNGPILASAIGSMAGIAEMDLPLTVVFTASSDGSSYAFTVSDVPSLPMQPQTVQVLPTPT
jgi:hypothetical protein